MSIVLGPRFRAAACTCALCVACGGTRPSAPRPPDRLDVGTPRQAPLGIEAQKTPSTLACDVASSRGFGGRILHNGSALFFDRRRVLLRLQRPLSASSLDALLKQHEL